ncbi:HAD family hydrolase [Sediminivirga luteola]|uniref:FMN phosphatase YigB (HAD superfamily) n=1 Tax=Sediminivirga luteola TaxID=1774748 RepID=A0A8J2TY15_9MICO|nr:HAD family hydrolase [Sediminivirga luteola]MCI2265843.1 hydrolase [Sediminivirga luteola]GGA14191.1 hypothetical protein GCM10011333_16370 [Sediminivirga luteola]
MSRNILVFDFDGTVALGEGPVTAYAEEIAARAGNRLLPALTEGLGAPDDALDAYDLIARRSREAGVGDAVLSAAYRASRDRLAAGACRVFPPRGLAEFLAGVGTKARRVLATNAPLTGIPQALEQLGLQKAFDEIRTDLGKPEGLAALLDDLPAHSRVLSIGDVWHNDLAPARERGHATALVGHGSAPSEAMPDMQAGTVAGLYGSIEQWLRQESASAPPVRQEPTTAR